jgi:hypothetical protein
MQLMAYDSQKKSAPLALVLSLLVFPGVGSIYADHFQGALITWVGLAGSIALIVLGVNDLANSQDIYGSTTSSSQRDRGGLLLTAGFVGFFAFDIYSAVDAWQSSNNYNAALAHRLGLPPMYISVAPIRTQSDLAWGPALALRF